MLKTLTLPQAVLVGFVMMALIIGATVGSTMRFLVSSGLVPSNQVSKPVTRCDCDHCLKFQRPVSPGSTGAIGATP